MNIVTNRSAGDAFRPSEEAQQHSLPLGAPNPVSSVLGQGRSDPFNVFAVQDVNLLVDEILDHGELFHHYTLVKI